MAVEQRIAFDIGEADIPSARRGTVDANVIDSVGIEVARQGYVARQAEVASFIVLPVARGIVDVPCRQCRPGAHHGDIGLAVAVEVARGASVGSGDSENNRIDCRPASVAVVQFPCPSDFRSRIVYLAEVGQPVAIVVGDDGITGKWSREACRYFCMVSGVEFPFGGGAVDQVVVGISGDRPKDREQESQ